MEKSTINYIIFLLIAVLIIGAGFYWIANSMKKENKEQPAKTTKELSQSEKILLEKYNYKEPDRYYIKIQKELDEEKTTNTIVKYGQKNYILMYYGLFQTSLYNDQENNETIYCLKMLDKEEICTKIDNQTSNQTKEYAAITKAEMQIFPNVEEKPMIEYFIKNNILKIESEAKNTTVNGINCTNISYSVDYEKINLTSLKKAGFEPANIGVGYFLNYKINECIEPQTKISIIENGEYKTTFYGLIQKKKNYVLEYKLNDEVEPITKPEAKASDNEIIKLTERIKQLNNDLQSCFDSIVTKDRCYMKAALELNEPTLCQAPKNETEQVYCYYQYALREKSPKYCEYTKEKKDQCYAEYVYLNKEYWLCEKITNQTLKQECLNLNQTKELNQTINQLINITN